MAKAERAYGRANVAYQRAKRANKKARRSNDKVEDEAKHMAMPHTEANLAALQQRRTAARTARDDAAQAHASFAAAIITARSVRYAANQVRDGNPDPRAAAYGTCA